MFNESSEIRRGPAMPRRPSESIDKFPNCRCHERSSGNRPLQSNHDGGEPVRTQSRTVIKVVSITVFSVIINHNKNEMYTHMQQDNCQFKFQSVYILPGWRSCMAELLLKWSYLANTSRKRKNLFCCCLIAIACMSKYI